MTDNALEQARESLDAIYRSESRRILATLIRQLSDFDLDEDALHAEQIRLLFSWP